MSWQTWSISDQVAILTPTLQLNLRNVKRSIHSGCDICAWHIVVCVKFITWAQPTYHFPLLGPLLLPFSMLVPCRAVGSVRLENRYRMTCVQRQLSLVETGKTIVLLEPTSYSPGTADDCLQSMSRPHEIKVTLFHKVQ